MSTRTQLVEQAQTWKLKAERLEFENAKLREALQSMLNVAENADETGYVTDVGFVDLDKLHEEVRTVLKT